MAPEGCWRAVGGTLSHRVVYCTSSPAGALLEVLVHIEIIPDELTQPLRYLEIYAPDSIPSESADVERIDRWQTNEAATQRLGNEWLDAGRSALLRVPSVIVPATWNVLINPLHDDSARIRVVRIHRQAIDPRLA
jgi:RES domain-containing protein